jgi:hypothetical protein
MSKKQPKKTYQKPEIQTYTEDEILNLIGPAHTVASDLPGKGLHLGWEKGKGNPHR